MNKKQFTTVDMDSQPVQSGMLHLIMACFGALLVAAPFYYVAVGGETAAGGPLIGIPNGAFLLSCFGIPAGVLLQVLVIRRIYQDRLQGCHTRAHTFAMWVAWCVTIAGILPAVFVGQIWLMMAGLPDSSLFFALLILGVILVVRGLRGKRVGSEPHCSKCDYNLTALTSEKCPECGTPVTQKTTIYGSTRQRRWALVAIGVTLPLLPSLSNFALLAVYMASTSDAPWRQPFETIMEQLESGDTMAIYELRDRADRGELSKEEAILVAQIALAEHNRTPFWSEQLVWSNILTTLEPTLTKAQKIQAMRQMAPLELMVPHQIRQGDPLSVEITYELRGIHGGRTTPVLQVRNIRVDGNPYDRDASALSHYPLLDPHWHLLTETLDVSTLEPGLHKVQYELQLVCFGMQSLFVSADFEVVPAVP